MLNPLQVSKNLDSISESLPAETSKKTILSLWNMVESAEAQSASFQKEIERECRKYGKIINIRVVSKQNFDSEIQVQF